MAVTEKPVDLCAPFERDTILEVRSSRMKTMPGLTITTGIDKKIRSERVSVSKAGLDADEHDMIFHGGPDKAVHGYCSSHYANWQQEYPEAKDRFVPGGFGENLVTAHMNERNVCIGDIVSVGDSGLTLQVSLPRQPCFKLNHRFQLKNFAPTTYKLSRTGWYYRVLHEGSVQAGDEIRLVKRKWPGWTIERVQEYLHRNQDDAEKNEELAAIEAMGDESRLNFQGRVTRLKAKQKREASGEPIKPVEKWTRYKLISKKKETSRISSFTFEALAQDPELKEGSYGSHIRLKLPNGLIRAYSIASGNANKFELGIALENPSRGGSEYLHKAIQEGDIIEASAPTTDIKVEGSKSNHVFIVGGVGITAFLTLVEGYRGIHWNTTLHYAVRSNEDVPFRPRIFEGDGVGDSLRLYDASKGERMEIPKIFQDLTFNSHVYVCGPPRLMEEAQREAKKAGLGEGDVHFEAFAADITGDPFDVDVVRKIKDGTKSIESSNPEEEKMTLQVASDETLLEVLRRDFAKKTSGVEIESACEVGNCGTCKITLRSGHVDHRGTALMDEEKETSMLSCVSRGVGRICIEV